MNVGIICACMPAIYSLFKYYFPQVFSGTAHGMSRVTGVSENRSGVRTPAFVPYDSRKDEKEIGDDDVRLVDLESVSNYNDGVAPGTAL